ncbi:hypothetical protein BHE74_00041852 [Ensete ventricosum]|uniref:Uncharacterized protein n=1 Tax=Ensete ventricosum TaxID=4639 RepID=A0A444C408_ENSVE|nr:hypothetical protein B296_00020358 [Ensete ventricosum]RWV80544.1 hypothetical protein GW17_00058172 [Ensete ventricosum]RWW51776.1 hypothetical protein BHE74_00041852 [Ensete ventricosum]RZR96692.1 hypothetical protein BHM03_00025750 [Ensete ventricosum]
MGSPVARLGFLAMVLVVLGAAGCGRAKTEDAYVTLLYGDEFLLGVRVLGKSIRDTGSTKDMVVLVSDGVSDYAKKLLDVGFLPLLFSVLVLCSFLKINQVKLRFLSIQRIGVL